MFIVHSEENLHLFDRAAVRGLKDLPSSTWPWSAHKVSEDIAKLGPTNKENLCYIYKVLGHQTHAQVVFPAQTKMVKLIGI